MFSIFEFDNYRIFIKNNINHRIKDNPSYSLRAFAKGCGLSPSYLSRIINGQRSLTLSTASKISTYLKLIPEEQEYLFHLIELESVQDEAQRIVILNKILKNKKTAPNPISLEAFKMIADWHHFAILSLTNTRSFQPNSKWISQRLGIKPLEASIALDRLIRLGLLEKKNKTYRAVNDANIETPHDIASAAVRENHRQSLNLALEALKCVEVEMREFSNITLTMDLSDLPAAKKRIRKFLDRFNSEMEKVPAQEVFQLNIQLYPLSRNVKS